MEVESTCSFFLFCLFKYTRKKTSYKENHFLSLFQFWFYPSFKCNTFCVCTIVFLITIESFTPFVQCAVRSRRRKKRYLLAFPWKVNTQNEKCACALILTRAKHNWSDFDIMHENRNENNTTVQLQLNMLKAKRNCQIHKQTGKKLPNSYSCFAIGYLFFIYLYQLVLKKNLSEENNTISIQFQLETMQYMLQSAYVSNLFTCFFFHSSYFHSALTPNTKTKYTFYFICYLYNFCFRYVCSFKID